jgi:GntR family transcriptional regulator / MocR family aminotransferase
MARHVTAFDLAGIELTRSASQPLFRQLYTALRASVLQGRLRAGTRLPSSRSLAAQFGLSRLTVMAALEQLAAEGYLQTRQGSGTFVADLRPPIGVDRRAPSRRTRPVSEPVRGPSRRSAAITELLRLRPTPLSAALAFAVGVPAVDAFPTNDWARAIRTAARNMGSMLLGPSDPAGYAPLREAIATYVGQARGVNCSAEQVMITAGTQQALNLAVRVLADPGDSIWVEDPGYRGARFAALSADCNVVPVPVDNQGLCIAQGLARPTPQLVYVTPSHQFPLGMTMTLPRRLALIEWARRAGAMILEDDSSSEFRHTGRPLAALQGLDEDDRVLYIGTFSKILCPGLRLAYMVVPRPLLDAFIAARIVADRQSPVLEQAATASFMADGHFARHLTRMRSVYRERQEALVNALRTRLAGLLRAEAAETGLHLVAWLPRTMSDEAVSRAAAKVGIEAQPLSRFRIALPGPPGLVLGFGGVPVPAIRPAVDRLAAALDSCHRRFRA